MIRKRRFWRGILAFVVAAAFAVAAGHEFVHAKHTAHCAACEFNHTGGSDLPVAAALLLIFVALHYISSTASVCPLTDNFFRHSGRSPPAAHF
jgi:propanediol dehydratase large subunit